MKNKLVAGVLASALALSAVAAPAKAQTYGLAYVTVITYQNLASSTANVTFTFYAENSGTTAATSNATLNGYAAGSLSVGSISSISAGFKGSTVMSADQPMAATLVQLPPGTAASKARPLSSGFSAGAPTVLLSTALKTAFSQQRTTIVSVQNTDSVANDFTLKFYEVGNPSPVATLSATNVPAGASKYFDLKTALSQATFNGSITIEAVKNGSTNPGSAVATALELSENAALEDAMAFEGVPSTDAATKLYSPSLLCNAFGAQAQTTYFAIQNSGATTATIDAIYVVGSSTFTVTKSAGPNGGKASFNGCEGGTPAGSNGAATFVSTQPLVGVGKVQSAPAGQAIYTGYNLLTSGPTKAALPYVRWATDANYANLTQASRAQRTFITIQNIGASAIASGTVSVRYYDATGALVNTHTLGALVVGGKANSNANSVPNSGTFEFGFNGGGSAVVEGPAGSQLAVVARVAQNQAVGGPLWAEDYNGTLVP